CNFFGGPATVRHKIEVLERACEAAGRDSSEISRTWLGTAIVTDSEAELQESLERLGTLLGVAPSAARGLALCGTEAQVRERIEEYRAAGVEGMIVSLLDPSDLDHLQRVGTTLREVLGD
ncbi:hypothetical protein ACWGK1_25485, partial [Streptomyces wedmorensis]